MSLEDISPKDASHLEQKLMSLPELTPDKITQLQKMMHSVTTLSPHRHCNSHENYFTDAMGILHKKVIDFQQYVLICSHTENTY